MDYFVESDLESENCSDNSIENIGIQARGNNFYFSRKIICMLDVVKKFSSSKLSFQT